MVSRPTEIAEHRQYLAFPLGFGEAVNFGQVVKARMLCFSRNGKDDMEIDETFFQPFCIAIQQPTVRYGDGIDLAAHQSDPPLRIRKAGDILNFFEPEEPSHDPADVVVAMADGLSAQAHARGLPELVEGSKSGLAARQKYIVSCAVRRANEMKLVEIVLNACFAEH